ncbi:2OG-Fe(II) oxygenase [Luteimonas sp. MC1828]|uniref:2OG-Fe(II) oxygenase n=1 Tax=Luteimonas sp. MC1828 TaxID=2799787 RepID=UPI0031BA9915
MSHDLDALRAQARAGDASAGYRLGQVLVAHMDMDAALVAYRSAAEAGHAGARVELARMLLHGIVGAPDPAAAVDWLQRAEADGDAVAAYHLALVALGGVALPRDGRINQRVARAVEAGYPPALRAAAIHFGRRAQADDQALALQLFERAAAAGDPVSAQLLAERLRRGEGGPVNPDVAASLDAQLAAHGRTRLPAIDAAMPWQPSSVPHQLAFEDALAMPPAELLAHRPHVSTIEGLLSADECRLLVACADPLLRASQTVDPVTGAALAMPLRTSSDASVDPVLEDLALRTVQLRICAAAGIDLVHAEHLIVLRYAPGQQYRPHRDYLPQAAIDGDRPQAGNRARTICVYLDAVEAGGGTEFPVAGVTVTPRAGRAVVFDNLLADGRPDPDSLHAGLPVERGVKWLATLWLRQRPYRDW